jgi:hypothetical protein
MSFNSISGNIKPVLANILAWAVTIGGAQMGAIDYVDAFMPVLQAMAFLSSVALSWYTILRRGSKKAQ